MLLKALFYQGVWGLCRARKQTAATLKIVARSQARDEARRRHFENIMKTLDRQNGDASSNR
jgi:hypothetical protein